MSFLTPSDDDARADDEILAWAAPDDFASTYETVPPGPFDPDVPPALSESQHGAYDAPYSAPAELSDPAFEEAAFVDPAYAEPAFEEGARDGRHEPVGLNRRLVLGTALAFVALVLLGLMLVTGGGDEPQTAASGETREAATPEFIDRPPATDEAPAFAEPEPFAYQTPQDAAAPMAAADPYAPAPYTGADYGAYDVPNNAAPDAPSAPSGSASGYAAAPRGVADADPREEGYLRARTSALMVDGSAGSMGTGGGTGASARQAAPRRDGLNLSASQREAYDALDPETQSAYREALQLSAAFGIDVAGGDAEATGSAAAQPEAPPARSGMLVAVPRGDGDGEAEAGPGPASRAAFLRRAQSAGTQEPFRVRTSGAAARPAVRSSPAARRGSTPRGPAAGDDPDVVPPGLSLLPGTVIPAVLVTGMNSELPGDVVAQVERDVFDSATLRHILIPKGTRLVGTYDDQIAYGQNRALVAWTTMVFPDGRTVELPGLPGVDLQSAAGLQDRVDRHFGRVFGSAVALAAVGTGLALATPTRDGVDLSPQTVASAQIAIELSRVATQVLRRELEVQPTVTIRPGYRLLVFLARAMEFDAPYVETPDPGRFRRFSRDGTSRDGSPQ